MGNTRASLKKIVLYITIVLFSLSALIGIISVLTSADSTAWKICATTAILGGVALLTLNGITRLESNRRSVRILGAVSIAAHFVWAIIAIMLIWSVLKHFICEDVDSCRTYYDVAEVLLQIMATAIIVAVCTTVSANLLTVKNYSAAVRSLKITAIISVIFLGVYFLPAIWLRETQYLGDTWQLISVVFIVAVFSGIMTPIFAILQRNKRKKEETPSDGAIDEVALRKKIEAEVRAEIEAEGK